MKIREARFRDWPAIEALAGTVPYAFLPLWDGTPFLRDASCVLIDESDHIRGALFASADESPVAWVRLAAVEDDLDIGRWLDLSLPKVFGELRAMGVREVAWMDCDEWAGPYLLRRGFRPLAEVVTLVKTTREIPASAAPGVTMRAARRGDFEAIATIDRKAFAPHWWRSAATLQRRAAAASSFAVAECGEKVIGYTEWESHLAAAHLNRIAVVPNYQGQGIGQFLLSHVVHTMWQSGVEKVSLNTQSHNRRARRLYDYFGFRPTGDSVTVWTRQLQKSRKS